MNPHPESFVDYDDATAFDPRPLTPPADFPELPGQTDAPGQTEGPDGQTPREAPTAEQAPERGQLVGVAPSIQGTALSRVTDVWGWVVPLIVKRDNMAKASARRGRPIHAYVGANGGMKSMAMAHDTRLSLEAGRRVLSTMRLLDYQNPGPCPGGLACDDPANHHVMKTVTMPHEDDPTVHVSHTYDTGRVHAKAHPLYVPFTDIRQLLEFRDGDVLMDEVAGVASSRESASMAPEIANWLMQLRRKNVLLRWSCPSWARADLIIRECTQAVTDCQGRLAVVRHSPDGTMMWRDRRMAIWSTYDAFDFDEFSQSKKEDLRPLLVQKFWRPGSVAERMYDTNDVVLSPTQVSPTGACLTCGGHRTRTKCSC